MKNLLKSIPFLFILSSCGNNQNNQLFSEKNELLFSLISPSTSYGVQIKINNKSEYTFYYDERIYNGTYQIKNIESKDSIIGYDNSDLDLSTTLVYKIVFSKIDDSLISPYRTMFSGNEDPSLYLYKYDSKNDSPYSARYVLIRKSTGAVIIGEGGNMSPERDYVFIAN